MKTWEKPEVKELNISDTATVVNAENQTSGEVTHQEDLGTCHNAYWAGNGLSHEEAEKNNPYWNNQGTSYWGN